MGVSLENRVSTRIHTRFETVFRAERQEGIGVLSDLSLAGARVEHCTWAPSIGSLVRLHVQMEEDRGPLELNGSVVRLTERGFVVQFEEATDDLRRTFESLELPLDDFMGSDPAIEEPLPGGAAGEARFGQYTIAELEELSALVGEEIERRQKLEEKGREARVRVREEVARLATREGLSLEDIASFISEAAAALDPGRADGESS